MTINDKNLCYNEKFYVLGQGVEKKNKKANCISRYFSLRLTDVL